jgi:phosphomannomutase
MKEVKAVIGGEGSGGVIYPELHYGRDALVGIALLLTYLAKQDTTLSSIRSQCPDYFMTKEKISLQERSQITPVLETLVSRYDKESLSQDDGLRIDFEDSWVHIRASNTEPIMRIITEAPSKEQSRQLAEKFITEINTIIN